ncbi:diguanylate cyclase (GGDEF) domain-containing protein [Desulfonatronum thiosulfatophilum]|uniref:diguanylate cyclase n=1 Tax=Desulfonatronum thiosulfatophilum TaxID=617002 RepID=A0A1G6ANS9_9BACT|nr:diguanylate cyclase [Desulfonatronum thiosulfatophilum]SDB10084.1 diguanylate cyclase (GGDEF) domain-containing protein [Desulfonatronum thiosulfatophilum]
MVEERQARILMVDDELVNIELIADIFDQDHEVLFAVNGEKALEVAMISAPDVILLDVLLPGMDGFEVCTRLKADPLTMDIPVIFITGLGDIAAEAKGLELGAMDYIAKPINPPVVRMRVRNQIELKRARDQLSRLASTDGLTGLANRRRFDEVLSMEHARHIRSGAELGLIMLDIDHFKLFNDTYGHVHGDDCLRAVADVLRESLHRTTDLAARYGGEEFTCILPDTVKAYAVAERIRKGVEDLRIPHGHSPTADHVTISLGVVDTCCTRETSPSQIVARADQELYAAKTQGRNRISYTPSVHCRTAAVGESETGPRDAAVS